MSERPGYIYVASSWRNLLYGSVIGTLRSAGLPHYDFRNHDATFAWQDVNPGWTKGQPVQVSEYVDGLSNPLAIAGFDADFAAMERADTFVLVLPCGRSAHLELGWAVGQGKRTAILLEDPAEPELMYRMVDYLAPSLFDLLGWLGVED